MDRIRDQNDDMDVDGIDGVDGVDGDNSYISSTVSYSWEHISCTNDLCKEIGTHTLYTL